jgi:alpha-L-fucosidase
MLADIVSKNGNLLLSIPQREDGSLDEKEIAILEEIADWMSINKEAIHGTRPWSIFAEGPIRAVGGAKKERQPLLSLEGAPRTEEQEKYGYTPRDIRFTTKGNSLYAILLGWPLEELVITSLPTSTRLWFGTIKNVELLGSKQDLTWKQDKVGLRIEMQKEKPCNHAYVIKISG